MDANTQKKATIKFFCTHCGDPLTGQSGSEVACSSCGTSNALPSADEHPSQILPSEHEEITKFFCSYCDQKLSSPVGFAGKEFECPTCSKTNVVPGEKPHLPSPRPYEQLLKFFCTRCGQKLSCEPELQGKTIDCPVCFEPTTTSTSSKDHPHPRLIVKRPASFPKSPPPPVEAPPAEAEATPATPTPLKPKLPHRPHTYRRKASDLPDFELQPVEQTKATEKLEQMLLLDESPQNPDQADLTAQRDAKAKAERDAKAKAEHEAKAKAVRDAKAKAEHEAKAKAVRDAKAKALRDAKVKAERDAKAKAERDAKAKAERDAKAKAERDAKAKADRDAKAKADRDAKAKANAEAQRGATVSPEADAMKELTGERTRESVKKNGKESASEKTSANRKLLTPPKSVNAPAPLPSSTDQIETEAHPVTTAQEKTLWNLFGLLKRNQPIDRTTDSTATSANGLPKDSPKAAASQGTSTSKERTPPKFAPAPHSWKLTSPASEGAPSTAESTSETQKGPVKKPSPSKTTAAKTGLPNSSGPIDKTKAAPSGKKKSAPRKAKSAPPRVLPPIKPKKKIPMGRRQLPKRPASPSEESAASTQTLSESNRASSLESASSLSDTQPIRLTNPINGNNRTILPQPRDEHEIIVDGPIRLGETESILPPPRVEQPSIMANKVAEALAKPNLEDDPFDALLDEDFDVEKLFPGVESSLSTAKSKK